MLLKPSFWSSGKAWYAMTSSQAFEENDVTGFNSALPILCIIKSCNASEHFMSAAEAHSLIDIMSILLRGKWCLAPKKGLPYGVSHIVSPELLI